MLKGEDRKYKFSIIMSIYNVESYLREAIESIVNQDIGFEENVQLILVNDGSPDNSETICIEYKKKYPNNVLYVKKENGGLASAKNYGLKYIEGKYINFFDPDDILSENTLSEVEKFFNKNYNTIPYVAIPLYFFEAKEGLHGKYQFLGNKNRIINLDTEPYNFTLSSASAFYKSEIFNDVQFNDKLKMSEDVLLNFSILEKYHCFGYVCQKEVRYNYRKRFTSGSIVDSYAENKNNFYILLKIWNEITKKGNIPNYIKEYFLYESRSRIREISNLIFEDKEEYENLLDSYREIISIIGIDYIASASRMLTSKNARYIYMSCILKENCPFKLARNGFFQYNGYNVFPVSNLDVNLMDIKFFKNKIRFEILFWDYNNKEIEFIAKNNIDGETYKWKEEKVINCQHNQKYGNFNICDTTRYILEIPYNKTKISFYVVDKNTGLEYRIKKINTPKKSKFVLRAREIRLFHGKYNLKFGGDELILKCYKYTGPAYNLNTYKYIKNRYGYKAKMRLLNRRKKKYILISDRPEKAGDNGEALFKYINKEEKRLAKKTYFVISKKSNDYKRLKKYGKVVKINSFRHKMLFLNAKAILSSHNHPLFFNAFDLENLKFYQDMFNYKYVWLQHGIIEKDVSKGANRYTAGYDYMVVSTEGERNELAQDKYLIYNNKKYLILNGLPRYDYLKNNPKNIITVAPTWREFLSGAISSTGFHEIKNGFEESEYYKKYSAILESKKINDLLKKNNYVLNFLLHPGMAGYEECFKKFENDNIKIIKAQDVNYQKVFEESKLLITDFSSVAFDFAYLKKPIIYYQFDKEKYFTKHYRQGYFEYERDGLGCVTYSENEIIDKIEFYFNTKFKMEDKYIERRNNTFKYTDKNNCNRLIDYLKKEKVIK